MGGVGGESKLARRLIRGMPEVVVGDTGAEDVNSDLSGWGKSLSAGYRGPLVRVSNNKEGKIKRGKDVERKAKQIGKKKEVRKKLSMSLKIPRGFAGGVRERGKAPLKEE